MQVTNGLQVSELRAAIKWSNDADNWLAVLAAMSAAFMEGTTLAELSRMDTVALRAFAHRNQIDDEIVDRALEEIRFRASCAQRLQQLDYSLDDIASMLHLKVPGVRSLLGINAGTSATAGGMA